jgi:hypothetical protein
MGTLYEKKRQELMEKEEERPAFIPQRRCCRGASTAEKQSCDRCGLLLNDFGVFGVRYRWKDDLMGVKVRKSRGIVTLTTGLEPLDMPRQMPLLIRQLREVVAGKHDGFTWWDRDSLLNQLSGELRKLLYRRLIP